MAERQNPEQLEVVIQECGQYGIDGERATLDLHYYLDRVTHAVLVPERGRPLNWPVHGFERNDPVIEIQGPNTHWRFLVMPDNNDPRR